MAQIIRIKRRIGAAGGPSAAQVTAGELAYHREAAAGAGAGPDDLWVGDGSAAHLLVGHDRQLEITGGAQTVNGLKTFATGATPSIAITGGTSGQVLSTNGSGVLSWVTTAGAPGTIAVEVVDPIDGDGTTATPLSLTMASGAQILAGTDTVFPIDSAGLRSQFGAAVTAANLGTTAATVVPAIHELAGRIVALTGAIIVTGSYNATTHQVHGVRPPASPGLAENAALPAAAASNRGWLFLVSTAGTGVAPAPTVAMAVGDWVISNGTDWVHLSMGLTSIAGGNVSAIPPGATPPESGWTTVQLFLNGLHTQISNFTTNGFPVLTDGVSITGSGVTNDELEVATVDAGTF